MLATRMIAGSSGAATQTLCGRSARAIRRVTIACSSRSLCRGEQLLAEVGVDGGVGGAARGAGERDRGGAQALAADEQLGRGADEGALAAADAVDVAGVEARAEHAEDGRRVVRAGRVHGDLAGEHDLLEGAGADPLDRAGDGGLVVLGRRGRGDDGSGRRAPGRAAAGARSRSSARRRSTRATSSSGTSSGAARTLTVRRTSRPRRASESSGTIRSAAPKPLPVRRARAVGGEGEAAEGDQAGAGRAVGDVADGAAGEPPPGGGDRARSGPGRGPPGGRCSRGRRSRRRRGRAAPGTPTRPRGAGRRTRPRAGRPRGRRAWSAPAATPSPDAPRTAHRALTALQQLRAGRAVQRKPAIGGPRLHAVTESRGTGGPRPLSPLLGLRSRRGRARGRSRPSAPSRPGRTGAPCARTPRPCRACR